MTDYRTLRLGFAFVTLLVVMGLTACTQSKPNPLPPIKTTGGVIQPLHGAVQFCKDNPEAPQC